MKAKAAYDKLLTSLYHTMRLRLLTQYPDESSELRNLRRELNYEEERGFVEFEKIIVALTE